MQQECSQPTAKMFPALEPHHERGLKLLEAARRLALEAGVGPWEYAVESSQLLATGLTVNDLRQWIDLGWVEHAEECTRGGKGQRRFRPLRSRALGPDTCFILTEAGVETIRVPTTAAPDPGPSPIVQVDGTVKPHWDRDSRTLSVGNQVVTRFAGRDGIQVELLDLLERLGWPPCVPDALSALTGTRRKRRLHDAIVDLNKRQVPLRVRFHGFAGGQGVRWELVLD